jgi:hypothetical protein
VPAGLRMPVPAKLDVAEFLSFKGSRWACTL